jgi:hypothetical protein
MQFTPMQPESKLCLGCFVPLGSHWAPQDRCDLWDWGCDASSDPALVFAVLASALPCSRALAIPRIFRHASLKLRLLELAFFCKPGDFVLQVSYLGELHEHLVVRQTLHVLLLQRAQLRP